MRRLVKAVCRAGVIFVIYMWGRVREIFIFKDAPLQWYPPPIEYTTCLIYRLTCPHTRPSGVTGVYPPLSMLNGCNRT